MCRWRSADRVCLMWTMRDLKNDTSSQMPARRAVLRGLALGGLSAAVAACGSKAGQSAVTPAAAAPTSALPDLPKTPDAALQRLMAGNDRLLANKALHTQTLDGIRA